MPHNTNKPSGQAAKRLHDNEATARAALDAALDAIERRHPKKIDMGLERVRIVCERAGLHFNCPVVLVAGTNGKGSTCAFIEAIVLAAGYRVGVYSSPHLIRFEERCRIDGKIVAAQDFLDAFAALDAARIGDSTDATIGMSYFEYSTLGAAWIMQRAQLDLVILEVGMGGRLDATNVFDPDCSVITSVDLDHMHFLGDDRESIGHEKAGVARADTPLVVGDPMPPASIARHAQAVGAQLWQQGKDFHFGGDQQQWRWWADGYGMHRQYAGLAFPALRGSNQLLNASAALMALAVLRDRLPVGAQDVRLGMARVALPGRFQMLAGQPAVVLDVAHNPHAAAALAVNLDAMGFFPVTHGVCGAMEDKQLEAMFAHLSPMIDHWYFCDLPSPRAATAEQLQQRWQTQNTRQDSRSLTFKTPVNALQAALHNATQADRIVVFGSFYTVGDIMENGMPVLHSRHGNTSPA